MKTVKIGSVVTYRGKPFLVLYVSKLGYVEIREYYENNGRIGWLTGPVEQVNLSEIKI